MKSRIIIVWLILIIASNFTYLIASAEKYEFSDNVNSTQESGDNPILAAVESPPVIERLFGADSADLAAAEYALSDQELSFGDLFVLDKLFNNDPLLKPDKTSLGDLFILDRVFNQGGFLKNKRLELGDLFVLDRLFRDDSVLLNHKGSTLGNIFILDQLFN